MPFEEIFGSAMLACVVAKEVLTRASANEEQEG